MRQFLLAENQLKVWLQSYQVGLFQPKNSKIWLLAKNRLLSYLKIWLQDSLGGNTKTMMVACLSPADNNYDETISTLRYANRAKNIKNKPKINEDPKDAMLREYQDEIQKLKAMLESQDGGGKNNHSNAFFKQYFNVLYVIEQALYGKLTSFNLGCFNLGYSFNVPPDSQQ